MFKNKWWTVVASVLALIVGNGVINVFAVAVFLKPIAQNLGFGRGTVSTAILAANWCTALAIPFVGRMIDRWGVRAVLLPSITLFAVAAAARALLTHSVVVLMIVFAVGGITGAGQSTTGYSKQIAMRFDRQRGLALGIALAGVGLGTALVPQFCNILLGRFGWRMGFLGLGVLTFVLAFIPVAIFFRDPEHKASPAQVRAKTTANAPGLTFSEAVRTWQLWAMVLIFFLSTVAINGTLIHLIAMLTDRGISVEVATAALSVSGLALIGGRLISGYLMDKIFAPYIGMFFMLSSIAGMAILGLGVHGVGPVLGTILMGMCIGAEIDMLAFLVGAYFGLRGFGAIHGFIYAGVLIANGAGAVILGWCYQLTKSYNGGLIAFEIMLVVSFCLFATLGPYRFSARRKPAAAAGSPVRAGAPSGAR